MAGYRTPVRSSTSLTGDNRNWSHRSMLRNGDVSEEAAVRREALARQVREGAAAKNEPRVQRSIASAPPPVNAGPRRPGRLLRRISSAQAVATERITGCGRLEIEGGGERRVNAELRGVGGGCGAIPGADALPVQ